MKYKLGSHRASTKKSKINFSYQSLWFYSFILYLFPKTNPAFINSEYDIYTKKTQTYLIVILRPTININGA